MIPYILGVDTETTGLEVDNGDKIIEIALIKYDLDGAKLEEFVQRIDPERNIDPKAQAGVSNSLYFCLCQKHYFPASNLRANYVKKIFIKKHSR